MYFQVCSNSTYPQHSGEQYRTSGPMVFIYKIFELYLLRVLQKYCPHVVQKAMERRTCVISDVFDRCRGHVINRILHLWSVNMKFMKLVV